jgi:DNA-binding transcriptional MerR regulator
VSRFTIDELAREAGTKVSTIRLYQQRGLLPRPAIDGRVGYYDDAHLARLRLVADLQARGYSLAAIRDLAETWESGRDLGAVLGVERALGAPATRTRVSRTDLDRRFPELEHDATLLARVEALGAARPLDGDEFEVDPGFLEIGSAMHSLGVPLDVMIDEFERVHAFAHDAAQRYVEQFEAYVWEPSFGGGAPNGVDLEQVAKAIGALRQSAVAVVAGALRDAIDAAAADAVARHAEALTRAPAAPSGRRRAGSVAPRRGRP